VPTLDEVMTMDMLKATDADGADIDACRPDFAFRTAINRQRMTSRRPAWARLQRQMRDGADRRQGFAAKAERADVEQVVLGELGGGMPLDCKFEIGSAHARAVVYHA
jgi:hypothetical protein